LDDELAIDDCPVFFEPVVWVQVGVSHNLASDLWRKVQHYVFSVFDHINPPIYREAKNLTIMILSIRDRYWSSISKY
jgi:hypothetical protein